MTNKLTDKDKKDWDNFLKGDEKIENKDKELLNEGKKFIEKTIDLHGYTLEDANRKIFEYIENCHLSNVDKINVITGKGLRSHTQNDPYVSKDLSILRYSVPEFIKSNIDLMKLIKEIRIADQEEGGRGAFIIYFKKSKE